MEIIFTGIAEIRIVYKCYFTEELIAMAVANWFRNRRLWITKPERLPLYQRGQSVINTGHCKKNSAIASYTSIQDK